MSDATDVLATAQATLDYWSTVESQDLTEIAGGEQEVLTEQADEATQAAVKIATAFPSPTEVFESANAKQVQVSTAIAYQLPNTGSGGGSSTGITILLVLAIVLVAAVAMIRRSTSPGR